MAEFDYSWENPAYRDMYHHTCSHILAQAVKRLYPGTKLAIGPAIEDGFYYDLDSETVFTPEELENADEIITASTTAICRRASALNGKPVGGRAIPLYEKLRDAYLKMIDECCR